MTPDYPTWRAERLAELDLMQPQIDELPEMIRAQVLNIIIELRDHVDYGRDTYRGPQDKYVENEISQLAAELDRITVKPASDEGEGNA